MIIHGKTFSMLKRAISLLKSGETVLMVAPENPDTEKINHYRNLLTLIEEHTDLRYELSPCEDGLRLKRI